MRLWRLSSARRAREFDGGYGLRNNGRWNTKGRPVTYCATVPSLSALEKRAHVSDPALLPDQTMVEYDVPDDIPLRRIEVGDLPADWVVGETQSQRRGDEWLDQVGEAILLVPSVIMPIASAPDRNVLINHRHSASARIRIVAATAFAFDPRLLRP
jgi:RES domain-containing protein